jgi:hypothetical protein
MKSFTLDIDNDVTAEVIAGELGIHPSRVTELDLDEIKREARLEAMETLRNIECKTCAAGIEFDERSHLHVEGQVCYALWIRRLIAAAEKEGKE